METYNFFERDSSTGLSSSIAKAIVSNGVAKWSGDGNVVEKLKALVESISGRNTDWSTLPALISGSRLWIVVEEQKSLSVRYRTKGSATSGNWGHAGRLRKRGGSAKRSVAMSITTGRDWQRRQALKRLETARRGTVLEDFNAYESEYSAWASNLSGDGRDAIWNYTGNDYTRVNGCLRGASEHCTDVTRDRIFDIDQALSEAPVVSEDTILYRGFSAERLADVNVGDMYEDKAFISASASADVAANFASESFVRGAVIQVIVPKGTKNGGAYISNISNHKEEKEWLLPRSSKFEIVDRGRSTTTKSGDRELITMLYVGPGDEKEFGEKEDKRPIFANNREDYFIWNPDDLVLVNRPKKIKVKKK